jgi:nucleotide-binding universal stress UspA family protein
MGQVRQPGWRVVAVLDGTQHAERALRYASALASVASGSVELLRVGDPLAESGLARLVLT